MRFLLEAEGHRLLNSAAAIPITCPVRILHGLQDSIVPQATPYALLSQLQSSNVHLTLIKV